MVDVIVVCSVRNVGLNEIIQQLTKLNFIVKDILININCIYGSIPQHSIETAKKIKGINYIEYDTVRGYIPEE